MDTKMWNDKQLQWQKERSDYFNNKLIADMDTKKEDIPELVDYSLCRISIKDNNIIFSSFPDNKTNIKLVRNTNYIFDTSDPSNLGHQLVVSRVPASGKVKDLNYQGIPGTLGSFVSIYIGKGRPTTLYYHDQKYKGLGGRLDIIDNC